MAKPGDQVRIQTGKEVVEGVFLPSFDSETLLVKLKSGYNIGLDKKEVKKVTVLGKNTPAAKPSHPKIPPKSGLPLIAILHTGGTIASRVDYRTGGVVSSFEPSELVAMFPELGTLANIESELIAQMWSDDFRFAHFTLMAKAIEKWVKKGVRGIIIGCGTDNLAVAAAALAFMVEKTPVPIILVGAQRSSDRGSSDAGMNLICAATFIAKTEFAGVAIAMHEREDDLTGAILPPAKTAKLHSSRRDAFTPVNDTAIARVHYQDRSVEFLKCTEFSTTSLTGGIKWMENSGTPKEPTQAKRASHQSMTGGGRFLLEKEYTKRSNTPLLIRPKMEEKVGLLKIHINMFPEQFEFFKGYKGLIIEGTGLGHTPGQAPNELAAIHKKIYPAIKKVIDSGCVVVMTTQCLFGAVNMNVYDKGRDLLNLGVISGKDMLANTALVKLSWLLGNYKKEEVKKLMGENLRGEINERLAYEEVFV